MPKGSKDKTESMKKVDGAKQDNAHNGWKLIKFLPNVKRFKVIISGFDAVFALFGIDKRLAPTLEFKRHTNARLNRYIKHQFRRMENCAKTNPLLF